jgi:hypothetical protein
VDRCSPDERETFFAAARDAVGEEPIAAGGGQALRTPDDTGNAETEPNRITKSALPPLMTPLVEEPIAMSGW